MTACCREGTQEAQWINRFTGWGWGVDLCGTGIWTWSSKISSSSRGGGRARNITLREQIVQAFTSRKKEQSLQRTWLWETGYAQRAASSGAHGLGEVGQGLMSHHLVWFDPTDMGSSYFISQEVFSQFILHGVNQLQPHFAADHISKEAGTVFETG